MYVHVCVCVCMCACVGLATLSELAGTKSVCTMCIYVLWRRKDTNSWKVGMRSTTSGGKMQHNSFIINYAMLRIAINGQSASLQKIVTKPLLDLHGVTFLFGSVFKRQVGGGSFPPHID